jgi:hypothetical protein
VAETKFGNNIITELKPGLDVPDFRSESASRMTHFLWLGDALVKGAFYMECVWIWKKSEGKGPEPHKHDYDEVLAFFGTNPDDIHDLGGELEIYIEDERHVSDKSCLIYIPKNTMHCPLRTLRLDRPIIHFVVGTKGAY